MKKAWRYLTSLMLVGGALLIVVNSSMAQDSETDRFSVTYFHRFAGNGGPAQIIFNNQYPPYSYETFIQNRRGVEFGYRSTSNMTIHARIDQSYSSSHEEQTQWMDDTFYEYNESDFTTDRISHTWDMSVDVMFEPFLNSQNGPVRAILGLGPFFSIISNDFESTYHRVDSTPPHYRYEGKHTDETMAMLIGLRGIIGAEWWIKERIGLICQTGFEAALFNSSTDEKNEQSQENTPVPSSSWEKETYEQNGWQAYSQQVMLGVRVKF
ncbi:hypothetical protein KQI63_13960 [bacterium]|nr:hypothetical protein [bacterium]